LVISTSRYYLCETKAKDMNNIKTITTKQYEKLSSIEIKAQQRAWKTNFNVDDKQLIKFQQRWTALAEKFGILGTLDEVRYKIEGGKDYSHGYYFGDSLA